MADSINTIVDEFPSPKGVWWLQILGGSLYCSGVEPLTVVDVGTKEAEVVADGVGVGGMALIGAGGANQRIYASTSGDELVEVVPALGNRFRSFAIWSDGDVHGFPLPSIVGTHSGRYLYLNDWHRLKIAVIDLDGPDPQAIDAIPFESAAFDMVVSPDDRFIYAALLSEDAVAVIDTTAVPWAIQKFPVANGPSGLALSADGKRLFVAQNGKPNPPTSGSLSVLDTSTMQGPTVDTGRGSADVVINAAESRAYVSNASDDTVSVVDISGTPTLVATITGFHSPGNMSISADGHRLYVAQFEFLQPSRGIAVVAI